MNQSRGAADARHHAGEFRHVVTDLAEALAQPGVEAGVVLGGQQLGQGVAHEGLGPVAQHAFDRGADIVQPLAGQVQQPDHVAAVLGQQAVALLAGAQLGLRFAQGRHLPGHGPQVAALAQQVNQRGQADQAQCAGQQQPQRLRDGLAHEFGLTLLGQQPPVGAGNGAHHAQRVDAAVVGAVEHLVGLGLPAQHAGGEVANDRPLAEGLGHILQHRDDLAAGQAAADRAGFHRRGRQGRAAQGRRQPAERQ